tara:strand:- start:64 stop:645 length:582 start_codon:yes stop_codon:yes gene_type:complete
MFTLIDNFYDYNDLGIMTLYFMNLPFNQTYQSQAWKVSNRLQAYPCYETQVFNESDVKDSPYHIFKKTLEKKTNIKPLLIQSLFRKIKLNELKNSSVYQKDRPHKDNIDFDYAGLIYFNSNSLKDGTKLYLEENDFDPTVIIGAKVNRCIFYDTQQPHSTPVDQNVEERWVQPFMLITKESTYEKHKEIITNK